MSITLSGEGFRSTITSQRSLKGRIGVYDVDGNLVAIDQLVTTENSLLKTVWKDGKFVKYLGFDEVRRNAGLVA